MRRAGQRLLAEVPGHGSCRTSASSCEASALERYPEALWHMEMPSASTPDLPRFLLAEAAARQVRVVLTGEGADEVFGGYPWHRADRLLHRASTLPLWLRQLLLLGPVGRDALAVEQPHRAGAEAAMDLPRYARMVGPARRGGSPRAVLADLRSRARRAREREAASRPATRPRPAAASPGSSTTTSGRAWPGT